MFLDTEHISKTYSNQSSPAIQDISFSVQKGEILTFLGASGSGKSTLLKILAGLLDADEGKTTLDGKKITGPSEHLVPGYDEIRLVNQGFKLGHKMKVIENLRYHLLRYPKEVQEQIVENLLDACQLKGLENKYPNELSGGQQQRVAIGRALANQPKLLLLDEPFSNLDTSLKYELRNTIEQIIRKLGTTAIFVMHDAQDALPLSDRIAVLEAGKLVQIGTPQEIYQKPQTAYVAKFFGQPNILTEKQLDLLLPDQNLSSSSSSLFCLRESSIGLNQVGKEVAGTVESVKYMGSFLSVLLKHESGIQLRLSTPPNIEVSPQSEVKVNFQMADLIPLGG